MNYKNHPMRTASGILTFITICFSLLLAGCHSDTDNPVTPGVNRSPQAFTPLAMWDDSGYSLDSASSMWIDPVSPIQPGDLAVSDFFGVIEISPLATAFVKANGCVEAEDAVINLVAFDLIGTQSADLNVDLAFDSDVDFFCRHPSVEVTYSHNLLTDEGHLGIHVVWSQWTGSGVNGFWALYYKYFHMLVDINGIDWDIDPGEYVISQIVTGVSLLDNIQPDLAVDAENGQLLVIFTQTNEPENTFNEILALQGVIQESTPVFWNANVYQVSSSLPIYVKTFPKIDVGLINTVPLVPAFTENLAVAAWSEWDPIFENFQIWYAVADPLDPNSIMSMQLTFSENGISGDDTPYEDWDFLPSVDIPAPSSASDEHPNLQAVICYEGADIVRDGQEITVNEQRVYCRITPDVLTEFLLRGDDDHNWGDYIEARVPEVACYQMNDPGLDYQWFGVAMHMTVGMHEQDFETYTGSWSYQVDGMGYVIPPPNFEYDWYTGNTSPFWTTDHPATGPTLCLRDTETGPLIRDQVFGLGWIQGVNTPDYVGLAQGSIYPT